MKIKGVKRVTAKGRHYYYHRATGKPIKAEFGTAAFINEVSDLDKESAARIEAAARVSEKSLGALIKAYRASPKFAGLAERTQKDYQKVFDYLQPLGKMPIEDLTTAFIVRLQDKTAASRKRRFANYVVQVLRLLLAWGKPRDFCTTNEAMGVGLIRRPRSMGRANRPWTPPEQETVLARGSSTIRVAVALGAFAGLREGDMIGFTWSGYDGSTVRWIQNKTGGAVEVKAHRRLRDILDTELATNRKRKVPAVHAVIGAKGRPLTGSGFRALFFRLIRTLEAEGAVGPGLTFHGLRHTIGDALADAGCKAEDIAAVLGHASESMTKHYTKGADQKKRAQTAISRLEGKRKSLPKPS